MIDLMPIVSMLILITLGALLGLLLKKTLLTDLKIKKNHNKALDWLIKISLWGLLFTMGFQTGRLEGIGEKLLSIGTFAVLGAGAAVAGSLLLAFLVEFFFYRNHSSSTGNVNVYKSPGIKGFLVHLKAPLFLFSIAVAGGLLGFFTPVFKEFSSQGFSGMLLNFLLFFIGWQMGASDQNLGAQILNWDNLILPLITILGTLLGGLALAVITPLRWWEGLSVVSGLGWYSLSGTLLANLGSPFLGSLAFLSNLMRESLSFVLIPLLGGYAMTRPAVSSAGATSMDVTLPLIKASCGTQAVPLALAHGVILSLVVPFLVPVVYGLGK